MAATKWQQANGAKKAQTDGQKRSETAQKVRKRAKMCKNSRKQAKTGENVRERLGCTFFIDRFLGHFSSGHTAVAIRFSEARFGNFCSFPHITILKNWKRPKGTLPKGTGGKVKF